MNFGRQLKRVKQQADHLFLRSDRTDVVGELRTAEEQVEELRVLCEGYVRALEKCLHTHATPDEKKLKKVPEYQAAETLKEALVYLPPQENPEQQDLLRTLMGRVVELQQALGMNLVEYEDLLEKQVLGPITHLIKDDFPSIAKQKKQLKQVGLDVDAAKTRWKSSQANPGPNAKMDTYREELEEAESKLDQTRDSYACDIFSLLSREREISQYVCSYLALQRDHLQRALSKLDLVLPDLHAQLQASVSSPVFGVPLHDHLRISHQEVALVLQVCVRRLVEAGLYEEGLLRVAGSSSKVRRLKGAFDAGLVTAERLAQAEEYDVHVVAGALRCYLRELPEPLLTHLLHHQWLEAVRLPDHQHRLRALWMVANQLPPANLTNLRYLIKFLALLASHDLHNKMTPTNIAIVVAPNLIWDQREPSGEAPDMSTLGRNMSLTSDYRAVVEHLVEYCDYFFKEDVDFGAVPPAPPSPTPSRVHPEPNGALPAPTPAPTPQARPAQHTHRRNTSTDLSGVTLAPLGPVPAETCESPKQPQRTKKKQAPRPPQVRPLSAHGAPGQGHNGQDGAGGANSSSESPETTRSHTPPREANPAPAPAQRLHHTNSIRRPTAEPPKPPGQAPAKPPRPSPPAAEALERTLGSVQQGPRPPLGFEQPHDNPKEEGEGVPRRREGGDEPCPIGFMVEEAPAPAPTPAPAPAPPAKTTAQSFFRSLETVLQQQAAGQPVALPRHGLPHLPTASEGEVPVPTRPAPAMPPTPAQRTTIPTPTPTLGRTPGHQPQDARLEKPALPEKPSLMTRSADASTLPRPHIPDRPSQLVGPAQRLATTTAPPSYNLPPPAQPYPLPPSEASTAPPTAEPKGKAEAAVEGGEGSTAGTEESKSAESVGEPAVHLETAHMYSVEKQQPTIVHMGPAHPQTQGPVTKGGSGGSGKFQWPPQPLDSASTPAAAPAAAAAVPATAAAVPAAAAAVPAAAAAVPAATTATVPATTTTITIGAADEPESLADSTNL